MDPTTATALLTPTTDLQCVWLLTLFALFGVAVVRWRNDELRDSKSSRQRRSERSRTWWNETVRKMDEQQFHENFRMSRRAWTNLAMLLDDDTFPSRLRGVGASESTAIFLHRLGSPAPLREIANHFGRSDSKIHEIVELMSERIATRLNRLIRTPVTPEEWEEIAARWRQHGNSKFPFACGAIDCIQIPIWQPSLPNRQTYVNRNSEFSYNVQAVCDDRLLFRHVWVGPPGSAADAQILADSQFSAGAAITIPQNYHLLGDAGYPLHLWLMTPYKHGHGRRLTEEQQKWNKELSFTRSSIERAFGLVKDRWQLLRNLQVRKQESIRELIRCAFILHNYVEIVEHGSTYGDIQQMISAWPEAPAVRMLDRLADRNDMDREAASRQRNTMCELYCQTIWEQ